MTTTTTTQTTSIKNPVIGGVEIHEVNYTSDIEPSGVEFLNLGEFMDEDDTHYYYGHERIRKDEVVSMYSDEKNYVYGPVVSPETSVKFSSYIVEKV